MKKNMFFEGYYTIEASILFPFMLILFLLFSFLCSREYNRVLLVCDSYYVLEKGREAALENKDYQTEMNKCFKQIKKESPYISCSNLKMSYSKKGNKLTINSSVDFNVPIGSYLTAFLLNSIDAKLSVSKSVSINKAQNVMRITYKLKEGN